MIEGYTTIKNIAEKWGITPRRVQVMCSQDKIPGAVKFGRDWAIPADAEKPEDGRITTGEYRNWRNKEESKNVNISSTEYRLIKQEVKIK